MIVEILILGGKGGGSINTVILSNDYYH
jgi:hypothetical protein